MFNQNDVLVLQERQRDLRRAAKRHNLAREARSLARRQPRPDNRRWARVLSMFL